MILFALKCAQDHRFEGWFRDGAAYEAQAAANEIACPLCGDTSVAKAPMAPRIGKGGASGAAAPEGGPQTGESPGSDGPAQSSPPQQASAGRTAVAGKLLETLRDLRKYVEKNADYVGTAFADEARKIHYGETEERSIYGETSDEEARALDEEGVPIGRIPWVPKHDA